MRKRGLSQPGWPAQKDMVQGIAAHLRRGDHHAEVLFDRALADEIAEGMRAKRAVHGLVVGRGVALDARVSNLGARVDLAGLNGAWFGDFGLLRHPCHASNSGHDEYA